MTSIGIDVGAKELVVAMIHKGKMQKVENYSNTPAGHKQIKKLCLKYLKYGIVRVAMEATGVYFFDLAVALSDDKKLHVMVVNPSVIKSYARAVQERNKTDKADAQVIAKYAERMDHPAWERPSDEALGLRYISRAIHTIIEYKAAAKNNLHALESCLEAPSFLIKSTENRIEFFKKEIEYLRSKAMTLITQNKLLKQRYDLLLTIKGFAQASAIQFLGEIVGMPSDLTDKQWVAFAGLDPRQFESGTSVKRKPRISKAGNRRMRKILFMPAMSASISDANIKGYVNHLVTNRGLAKMQAITAVMRKLLHAIHAMFQQLKPFDSTRFYVLPVEG
jgi:transposase